jgi:hypothetical protein
MDKYGKENLSISTRSQRCMGCESKFYTVNFSTRQRTSISTFLDAFVCGFTTFAKCTGTDCK